MQFTEYSEVWLIWVREKAISLMLEKSICPYDPESPLPPVKKPEIKKKKHVKGMPLHSPLRFSQKDTKSIKGKDKSSVKFSNVKARSSKGKVRSNVSPSKIPKRKNKAKDKTKVSGQGLSNKDTDLPGASLSNQGSISNRGGKKRSPLHHPRACLLQRS